MISPDNTVSTVKIPFSAGLCSRARLAKNLVIRDPDPDLRFPGSGFAPEKYQIFVRRKILIKSKIRADYPLGQRLIVKQSQLTVIYTL